MKKSNTEDKILIILLKQFSTKWTITSLAEEINISRVGIWKILKKLELEKLIILNSIGQGKTNTILITLNWESIVLEKKLALVLTQEAIIYQRWLTEFEDLKDIAEFILLYGSILHSPKEANDIDISGIVSNKNYFLKIERAVQKIQKSQIKKIHLESFTKKEFEDEVRKPNKIFIDALKKGIILFGQEKFIGFVRDLQKWKKK
jgi:DNA-binding Lrp family transcriptional regulator